jgi:hypothetical protein
MYEFNRMEENFGLLKVADKSECSNPESDWWICLCECGNARIVEESRLMMRMITMCVTCEMKKKIDRSN